jgi:RNA-directed DNA polymerase
VLCLIRRYLKAGIMEGGLISQSVMGMPQGGPMTVWTQKATLSLTA